jgi:hypothetical protein
MIQRIQSLWLFIAAALAFLTLRFSFYSGHLIATPLPYTVVNATYSIPLIVLTVVTAVVSFITIFLYKDRNMQMKLSFLALIVSVVDIVLYFLQKEKFIPEQSSFDLTSIFAFLIPVFIVLAIRGLYSDRKLIKSVDRLR